MEHPTITIRRGRLDDAPTEAALHKSVDWCFDEANMITEYHDDAYEASSVLVAELDGKVVGKLELFLAYKSQHGRFGLIRRFVVHPDYRARGIGTALLQSATEQAKATGCSFLELSVDVTNPIAHAFYQREGFVEDRIEVLMRKPLDGEDHSSNYQAQAEEWDS